MTVLLSSRLRPDVGGGSRTGTGASGGRTGGELLPPGPTGLPIRRRWGRVAAGVGLLVVWIWGTVAMVRSAGDRSEIIAVAHDVARYEQIERADLQVVRGGLDPGVETVPAAQIDDVVGRTAAVDLVPGSLLATGQLVAKGQRVVGQGEAVVGARLKPGEFPPDGVTTGSDVVVVVRPAPSAVTAAAGESDAGTSEIEGWLLGVDQPDGTTGDRSLSLVVPRSQAASVTAAAADGRVSLIVVES